MDFWRTQHPDSLVSIEIYIVEVRIHANWVQCGGGGATFDWELLHEPIFFHSDSLYGSRIEKFQNVL